MQLNAEQQAIARQWIADGMKLSEFQKRLEADFGIRITYMETRLIVDDLKVMPKDPEPPKKEEPKVDATPLVAPAAATEPTAGGSGVSMTVDAVTRPGTMVSGRVTFSDAQAGTWYIDQYGRPGLASDTKGYRPSPADLQEFQILLEKELMKLGI